MRYEAKLSEQEELNLRQLAVHPGFDALLKLLSIERLNAQAEVMDCTDPDEKKRLLVLSDAQAVSKVVSSLTAKLSTYRQIPMPQQPEGLDENDPLNFILFSERTTH